MTQDFTGFGLPAKLLQALERMKFTTPTPVQKEAIPLALTGADILGSAQTGTGKTGAFGIPLIAKLMEHPTAQALVMTPTRELASQVMAAIQQMIPVPNIKTALLIGGESMPRQFRQLDQHPRLIVGTPGRITDHLMRGSLKLAEARFLVLDETDRMLDMGFGPQIDEIMKYMPAERQTMMFSATLPENIIRMSRKYMKEPKRIAVGSTNTAHTNIKQELIKMGEGEKYQHLLDQLGKREGSVIIFVKTKYGTEKLADKLNKDQHKSDAIHGDLQQRRRERVIQGFRDKRYRVLVATDVAARGLDIPHIEHVINYDMPQCPEDYIHRIGRTARAGAEGSAVNFLTSADHSKWNAIYRLMNPGAKSERHETGAQDNNRRGSPQGKRWGAGGGRDRFNKDRGERSGGFGGRREGHRDGGQRGDAMARSEGYRPAHERTADSAQRSPAFRPREHKPQAEEGRGEAPRAERRFDKPRGDRPFDKPRSEGPRGERRFDKPRGERPAGEGGFRGDKRRDERRHSDAPRPFDKPRSADGAPRDASAPRSEHRKSGGERRSFGGGFRKEGHRGQGGGQRRFGGGGFGGKKSSSAH